MVSETDLNLLESYLDDALSPSEVQSVDARISAEPDVAAALDALRRERSLRSAAFAAMTPTEQQADRFSAKVLSSFRQREFSNRIFRGALMYGGIAACLLIGFAVGWLGRGRTASQIATPATPHVEIKKVDQPGTPSRGPGDGQLVIDAGNHPEAGKYQVSVFDENGKVIAVQPFDNAQDARKFSEDIKQYEVRLHRVQEGLAEPSANPF